MNWRHHTLPLAALFTGAALILGAVSLTIAVISMVTPLTPAQLTFAQSMGGVHFKYLLWILPAFTVAEGLRELVHIALRRPFGRSAERAALVEVTDAKITITTGLVIAGVAAGLLAVFLAIGSIRLSGGRPITECDAFAGLSLPIGTISMLCWNLGYLLFRRWWQDERGVAINA